MIVVNAWLLTDMIAFWSFKKMDLQSDTRNLNGLQDDGISSMDDIVLVCVLNALYR